MSPAVSRRDNDNYIDDDDDLNSNYWDDDPYDDQPQEQERSDPSDELERESYSTPAGTARILLPSSTLLPPCIILCGWHVLWFCFQFLVPTTFRRLGATVRRCHRGNVHTRNRSSIALQHVALAKRVREQFEMAYESVLQDEYSDAALQGAHLCHAWHSLFSRQAI
jgi:hypothetical protein